MRECPLPGVDVPQGHTFTGKLCNVSPGKIESIKGPSTGYREERDRKRKGNLIIGKHEKIKLEKIFLCFVILKLTCCSV